MPRSSGCTVLRLFAFLMGAGLVVWAVALAWGRIDSEVWRHMGLCQVLQLGALVGVNLVLTGTLFWAVTLSFDAQPRIGIGRMIQLVCASSLINYLPLGWPGPVARTAYLKRRHDMPVTQSLVVLMVVMVLSLVVAAVTVAMQVLPGESQRLTLGLVVVMLLTAVSAPVSQWVLGRKTVIAWTWLPIKTLDTAMGALRLWIAFRILGQPIAYTDALVLAGADMLVSMIAVTPSGLGVSEWTVGLLANALSLSQGPTGQIAKLIDRAVSVIVLIPVGLASLSILSSERRGR